MPSPLLSCLRGGLESSVQSTPKVFKCGSALSELKVPEHLSVRSTPEVFKCGSALSEPEVRENLSVQPKTNMNVMECNDDNIYLSPTKQDIITTLLSNALVRRNKKLARTSHPLC